MHATTRNRIGRTINCFPVSDLELVLWKRLNTETPQHGNASTRKRLNTFPHFLGLFPIFRKSFKISVGWSVSSFFGSVSSFLGPFPDFRKSFKLSVCWSFSSFFRSVSSCFRSVSGFLITFKFLVSAFFYLPKWN